MHELDTHMNFMIYCIHLFDTIKIESYYTFKSKMLITVAMICTFRAATNCDIFVLKKADLDRALSFYPEIAKQIQEVAKARAAIARKQSMIADKARAERIKAAYAANIDTQVV